MPKINGKIYYNNVTGNVLLVINQNEGVWLRETTFAEDVATYPQLKEVNKDVIKLKRLEWDEFKSDFEVSRPVQFKDGFFLWSMFDQPEDAKPQEAISKKISNLEQENKLIKVKNEALSERGDFHEEVLTEIILMISS